MLQSEAGVVQPIFRIECDCIPAVVVAFWKLWAVRRGVLFYKQEKCFESI